MKASARSVRIAPKKANLIAKLVRGMPVPEALESLRKTNKKAARILEQVIASAAANAKQNFNQDTDGMIVKSLIVNKSVAYHRGIPMARGRMRRIRKFLSHINVTLGYPDDKTEEAPKAEAKPKAEASAKSTADKKKAPAKAAAPKKKPTASAKSTADKKKATTSKSSSSSK